MEDEKEKDEPKVQAENNSITLGADFLKFYSGNASVSSRPVLIIEYYMP